MKNTCHYKSKRNFEKQPQEKKYDHEKGINVIRLRKSLIGVIHMYLILHTIVFITFVQIIAF